MRRFHKNKYSWNERKAEIMLGSNQLLRVHNYSAGIVISAKKVRTTLVATLDTSADTNVHL